jgi:SPP1 gp7 family putative phage head morphogenesis protein
VPWDIEKLYRAMAKRKRVGGVSAPAGFVLANETLLVNRCVSLWNRAANALLTERRPIGDAVFDLSPDRVINQIYERYGGIEQLYQQLTKNFVRGSKKHKTEFRRKMTEAIGTDIKDLLSEPRAAAEVKAGVDRSIALIKTLDEDMKTKLGERYWRGLHEHDNVTDFRKFISKGSMLPAWRAKLIARDQTAKLYSHLSRIRQEDIGVTQYIWRTVGDGAVRPTHAAQDGLKYSWDNPSTETGHPGDDIQCRCVADPDLSGLKLFQ